MDEILKIILGDVTLYEMFGFIWFFIIGYLLYGLVEVTGRDKLSLNTPRKLSFKFWVQDNWRRYLTTIICTYILFRFYTEISGHPFTYFDAVTLGMIGDGIAATVKKRIKGMGVNREKIMTIINNNDATNDAISDATNDATNDDIG